MYRVSVERQFRAMHAIVIRGEREAPHAHDWRVRAWVEGPALDDDGLLCDFHLVEGELERIVEPWRDADLNRTPPFDRVNPTAEHLARHVADHLEKVLPDGVKLHAVAVTEAPGCVATWVARR